VNDEGEKSPNFSFLKGRKRNLFLYAKLEKKMLLCLAAKGIDDTILIYKMDGKLIVLKQCERKVCYFPYLEASTHS